MLNLDQLEAENEARRKQRDSERRASGDETFPYGEWRAVMDEWQTFFRNDNAVEVIEQLIAEVRRLTQGEKT